MHASIYNGRRAFIRFQWRSFTDHRSLRLASRSLREIVPPDVTNIASFVPPRKITSIGAREIASLPLSFVAFRLSSHTHAHTRTRTHSSRFSLSLSLLEENLVSYYSRIGNFKYTNRRIISTWNRAKLDATEVSSFSVTHAPLRFVLKIYTCT